MKKAWIKLGACALALMMALVFVGCEGPRGPAGQAGPGFGWRHVNSGTFHTYGFGYDHQVPIHLATTFANNTIVDVRVTSHRERPHIMYQVESRFIPRVRQMQSIGVDSIAGATASSEGVRSALAAAIYDAGGNYMDWMVEPAPQNRTVVLPFDGGVYDVIVVGLGGAGTAAFMSAAEHTNTSVFGIEAAAAVGGLSTVAQGQFALGTSLQGLAGSRASGAPAFIGAPTTPANTLWTPNPLAQPYIDAYYEHFGRTFGGRTGGNFNTDTSGQVFEPAAGGWAGGADMTVFRTFLEQSGPTVDWLLGWGWNFNDPGGIVWRPWENFRNTTHESPRGMATNQGLQRYRFFVEGLRRAMSINRRAEYMTELTATRILTEGDTTTGRIIGVQARHRDGTTFMIMGRNVILATGGFVGNPSLLATHYGSGAVIRPNSINPEVARNYRGIFMAKEQLNAATFNLRAPPINHNLNILNQFPDRIGNLSQSESGKWKQTLTSLLFRPQNMLIALEMGWDGQRDFRGRRFIGEVSTSAYVSESDAIAFGGPLRTNPFGTGANAGLVNLAGGAARSIANEGNRAGGRVAAIISNDQLYRLVVDPIGHQHGWGWLSLPWGYQAVGADDPVPFIRDLIQWASSSAGRNNVIQRATLAELETALGLGAVTGRLAETITAYNAVVEQARVLYAADGTPRPWPGQDVTVSGSTPDPLSYELNELGGIFNFGKPLFGGQAGVGGGAGHRRLWDIPVTRADGQQASWDAWLNTLSTTNRALAEAVGFTPGYTAILGGHFSYGTLGGLDVNVRMQVMRLNQASRAEQVAIPGLFATGLDSHGILHHRNRTYSNAGGKGLGWVYTSGRLAGRYAAIDAAAMRAAGN